MRTLLLCAWDMAFNGKTFCFCDGLKNSIKIWI